MSNKTLIVGATGVVGSELVRHYAEAGVPVRALVRSAAKAAQLPKNCEPVIGDMSTPHTLAPAFEGIERVFVLSPPVAELAEWVHAAFDAALAAGARRVVYLSALGTGVFDDLHFHAHRRNEDRVKALGPAWTILRPSRFTTSTPFTWKPVFEQGIVLEDGGAGRFTTFDPSDIATVAFRALREDRHEGKTYELTSREALSASELAQLISRTFRREVRAFEGDGQALRAALIAGGVPPGYAELMAGYFRTVRDGWWHPNGTAEAVLGRPPRSYADWLADNHERLAPR